MKWFLGTLLVLLIALILQSGLLAYAMYVLLGVLIVSRFLARSWTNQIQAQRKCKRATAEVGDQVEIALTIRNSGKLPVPWMILEDLLPPRSTDGPNPRLKIKGKRIQIRMLPPGQDIDLSYKMECLMRGYYQIGPLVMESGDLFGLHRRYRVDADPDYLMVYPKVVPLKGFDIASRRPIGDVQLTHRLYEDPTRIGGVRPYESGDPLNRIHWRATARAGFLHSKIYEPTTLAGITLLLDFHKAVYPRRGEPFRSELAVTTAASLANAVFELGQQVGLVTNGRDAADRIRQEGWRHDYRTRLAVRHETAMQPASSRLQPIVLHTQRSVEQFQRIRETLARVELTDGMSFPQVIIETACRLRRDATVVAILPEASVETAISLANLRRQGFAVSVVLLAMDEEQQEKGYGRLRAEGILDVRVLHNEAELSELCQQHLLRSTPYALTVDLG